MKTRFALRHFPCLFAALLACTGLSAHAQSIDPVATDPILVSPDPVAVGSPQLTGSLSTLKVDGPDEGKYTLFKTTLTLNNAGPTVARNVTATLFVSSTPYLGSDSSKIKDIVLPAGKIGKGKTATLLIKHRVQTVISPYFEGKYLVVAFHADNVPFGIGHPASLPPAVGPIKLR